MPDIMNVHSHKGVVASSNRIWVFGESQMANEIDPEKLEPKPFLAKYDGWGIHGTPWEYEGNIYFTCIYAIVHS